MIREFFKSAVIWFVYFPHGALLRLIGPRCAVLYMRGLTFIYWLFTFVGAAKRIRQAMARVLPEIRPDLRVSTVLRKHLVVKHQFFTEWHLYPTPRGRRFVEQTYRNFEGREHLDAVLARGRGAIILSHHFGMFRMTTPALKAHGYDTHTLVLRGTTYAGQTYGSVAQAVTGKRESVDETSGLNVIYLRPAAAFRTMVRLLNRNGIVALASDAMTGTHFVRAPFLGGTMLFPTGPARLAAGTGAGIVPTFTMLDGLTRHRMIAHPPIYCEDKSSDVVERTVLAYVKLMEEYTRTYPWAWWTWRRLEIEKDADGRVRFEVRDAPIQDDLRSTPEVERRVPAPTALNGTHGATV